MQAPRPDGAAQAFVQKLGQEDGDARKFFYLVTAWDTCCGWGRPARRREFESAGDWAS